MHSNEGKSTRKLWRGEDKSVSKPRRGKGNSARKQGMRGRRHNVRGRNWRRGGRGAWIGNYNSSSK